MKLSDIQVRWYDVIFFCGFPPAYNYFFGMDGAALYPGIATTMSYIWFMSKRQKANPDSNTDA
jgi:hypothetical protein